MRIRAVAAGFALAVTPGWNVGNVGAVADGLSHAYGAGLVVIGLFTTALFVTHAAFQVPAGRLCDRFGARLVGGCGLAVVAAASGGALLWREAGFAIAMRTLTGVGTALAFVGGSDYVRSTIGSAVAQGWYGATSVGAGGVALAVVPLWGSWRAPFATAALVALAGLGLVLLAPAGGRLPPVSRQLPRIVDRVLLRLALLHAASFGLSVIVGSWVVTLLERAGGDSSRVAGAVGALVLLPGIVTRPLGGRLGLGSRWLVWSFVAGGLAVAVLALAMPLPLAICAAAVAGLAAGVPFAPTFSGAQRLRADAPGAAVGLVNAAAAVTILVGAPLVGLTFSLPGNGRIGMLVVATLWASTALVGSKIGRSARLESAIVRQWDPKKRLTPSTCRSATSTTRGSSRRFACGRARRIRSTRPPSRSPRCWRP
jgi:MFS family permease